MKLGIVCQLECKPRLEMRLALHKKCPNCGKVNDLRAFTDALVEPILKCPTLKLGDINQIIIPLCQHCYKPLWKYRKRFNKLLKNRIDYEIE